MRLWQVAIVAPFQRPSFNDIDRKLACFRIGVDNRDYHQLSHSEIGGGKRISQHQFLDTRLIGTWTLAEFWQIRIRELANGTTSVPNVSDRSECDKGQGCAKHSAEENEIHCT